MASRKYLPWLLVPVLAALGYWLGGQTGELVGPRQPASATIVNLAPPSPDCPVIGEGCTVDGAAAASMELRFRGPVKPLEPFTVTLETEQPLDAVSLEFDMTAMDMGVNRFELHRQPDGAWQGQVVLPMCSTGRRDWVATLDARHGDTAYRARIPFRMP